MSERRYFVLVHEAARDGAMRAIHEAPEGFVVEIKPPTRTGEQNAKFHAICGDVAKAGFLWANRRRDAKQVKVLFVSGHATATGEGSEVVPGLEGEFINLRESTALMSKKRGASLIEYSMAYCAMHGIYLPDRMAA